MLYSSGDRFKAKIDKGKLAERLSELIQDLNRPVPVEGMELNSHENGRVFTSLSC